MKHSGWLTALIYSIFFCACANSASHNKYVYPSEKWQVWETAHQAGFNFTNRSKARIQSVLINEMATTGLVIVVGGKILEEYGNTEELSYIASCRKSILALLYGKYVANNTIDLSMSLKTLDIDDINKLTELEKTATIKDIISSRSGVFHPASYAGDDLSLAPPRGSKKPGTYFLYSNWDFNLAGEIFEKLSGQDIYQSLEEDLAIPLQFEHFDRSKQVKTGDLSISKFSAYPIWLSTRDMARIGYLMLRKGRWKQEQLFTESWIQNIVSTKTPLDDMNFNRQQGLEFGYMWWLWPDSAPSLFQGAYTALGMYGQFITVIPKLDLVVAHKTNSIYGRTTKWESYVKFLTLLVGAAIPATQ